ncbi:MAG: ATP-binding protein [Ardenticatenaceae bacterium]|nr:ATP-binding protein [Ardenticatenaceae bacterium]
MNVHWSPNLFILSAAALLSYLSAGYVWYRFHHKSTARMGAVLILATGWWIMGSVLEISSVHASSRIFWDKAQFIAIVVIPSGWLTYALRYAGKIGKLTLRRFVLLWAVPSLTLFLVFTNEYHRLIWSSYQLVRVDGLLVRYATYGPAYWLFMIFANIVILIGIAYMMRLLLSSGHLYRWQAGVLMIIVVLPWIANIVSNLLHWRPIPGLDLTPVALAITVSTAGWILYRVQVWDVSPVAKHMIIDQMGDGVLVLDAQHCIIDVNPVMIDLLQKHKSDVFGRPIQQFWPNWPQPFFDSQGATGLQMEWVLGETNPRTFDIRMSLLFDGRKQLASRIFVLRDIGERKQMEQRLQASLYEKDVLLKEIHHRVKNNLQVISSLLNLQASQTTEPAVLQALLEGQDRVRSMSLIHEILYRSDNLAQIDFGMYVRELASQLHQTYSLDDGQIDMDVQVETVLLPLDTAVPCGLILNELVSNALKHAFSDGRSGQIIIQLQTGNGRGCHLTVTDNGMGFPPQLDYRQATTLGLKLINSLIDQLDGSLTVTTSHQGTSITVTFTDKTSTDAS